MVKKTIPGIRIDTAELLGIFLEGPLFGIFLVLDIIAMNILIRRRRRRTSFNPFFITAATLMLLLSTAQFAVDASTVFMAFMPDHNRKARQAFFLDLSRPVYAARHALYFTMMLVGDSIVIYRCYIVWNRNFWVVLIPVLCSLASRACSYQTIWAITHPFNPASLQFEIRMGFTVFGTSFSANFIATALLAYKIWTADKDIRKALATSSTAGRAFTPVIRIVVESGLVNTLYLLAYTIILAKGSDGIQIMASIVTPLVGIIFTTVIIRASLAAERLAKDTYEENSGVSRSAPVFADNKLSSQSVGTVVDGTRDREGDDGSKAVVEMKSFSWTVVDDSARV